VTFVILVRVFRVNQLIANPIGMSVGIINNFLINAHYNFKKTDRLLSRFSKFYMVGLVGVAVGNFMLWFFNGIVGANVSSVLAFVWEPLSNYRLEIVKAVSIVIIGVMQFFLNKRFSFKE
jgi:putative flippase GtrA